MLGSTVINSSNHSLVKGTLNAGKRGVLSRGEEWGAGWVGAEGLYIIFVKVKVKIYSVSILNKES